MPPSIPKASYSGDPEIHLPSMLWYYVGMPFLIPETCFANFKVKFSRKSYVPPRVHFQTNLLISKIAAQTRRLIFAEKLVLGICGIILVRCDIVLVRYDIISVVQYIKGNIY